MSSTGCCSFCCHKPRHKRLVDALFPDDPQNSDILTQDLDKLLYLAKSEPERLDDVGEYLVIKLRRALVRDRRGHTCVSLKIMEKLLSEVSVEHLQLLAESFLNMVHELLHSNNHFFQNLAANSFVSFAEHEEESPPYHRQYDFCIERFAAMSLSKKIGDDDSSYLESRLAGLRALRGVVHKVGSENSNLWDSNHLNMIIPAFLINMEDHPHVGDLEVATNSSDTLVKIAESGFKELVTTSSLSHSSAILTPVLRHFDLSGVWLKESRFATDSFILIIQTMQPQVRYLAIQALLSHLDAKTKQEQQLKCAILEVLSCCVGVAADGSIGPSVLDVFRTLVKNLRNSIEDSNGQQEDKAFHETIVRTVGEFASVLPDYHNPDIMNLIYSYLPFEGDGTIKSLRSCNKREAELVSLLIKCLCVVAESAKPSALETLLPESLLVSLSQLLDIEREDIQLHVILLWHKMLDHHQNKSKIPLNTNWESLGECGLVLGNASVRFRQQTRKVLFPKLINLAGSIFLTKENAIGFYILLHLLGLEFAAPGISDMLVLMVELQDLAISQPDLSVKHRHFLHSCVAGCLHFLTIVGDDDNLGSYVEEIIKSRQSTHQYLLPEAMFQDLEETTDQNSNTVQFQIDGHNEEEQDREEPYFKLVEKQFVHHTTEMMRNSSLKEHSSLAVGDYSRSVRSYSMDHSDDQESNEAITFDHLKEEGLEQQSPLIEAISSLSQSAPSYEEMLGRVSHNSSLRDDVADILKSTSPMVSSGGIAGKELKAPSLSFL